MKDKTSLLVRIAYPIMSPHYKVNGEMTWKYNMTKSERLKGKPFFSQYSCPQTYETYLEYDNLTIADLEKKKKHRYPLTVKDENGSPYQKVNWKYIEYVVDLIGSNFVGDICEHIICDLKHMTPDKFIDMFQCQSNVYSYFISWLGNSKLSNNMLQVSKIFKSTFDNVTFIPEYIAYDSTSMNLKACSTKTLFDKKFVYSKDEDDVEPLMIQVDFVSYIKYYSMYADKHIFEDIKVEDDEIKMIDSYEDVLMENELYRKNSEIIKGVLSKVRNGISSTIGSYITSNDSFNGIIEKVGPLIKMMQ